MKTREEMIAAIDEIVKEAEASDFTFVAGIDADGLTTIVATGNNLTRLGMAHVMRDCIKNDIKKS